MAVIGLQTSKMSNNLRIVYLIALLPILLFLCVWAFFALNNSNYVDDGKSPLNLALTTLLYSSPVILLWLVI
jgi:hypothetical protein